MPVGYCASYTKKPVDLPRVHGLTYTIEDLKLTQTAALMLLQGGSLAQVFDGAILCFEGHVFPKGHREKPLLLVRSEFPELEMPPPRISRIVLAELEVVDPAASLEEVRREIFMHVSQ